MEKLRSLERHATQSCEGVLGKQKGIDKHSLIPEAIESPSILLDDPCRLPAHETYICNTGELFFPLENKVFHNNITI